MRDRVSVYSVAVQADGKVLLGGFFTTLQPNGAASTTTRRYLARLNADGTLDTGFDPKPNNVVYSVAVQADGKMLLGGAFTTLQPSNAASPTARQKIARVNADGTLDTGFDPKADTDVRCVAVQADEKVLLGGAFTTLQPNGAGFPTPRQYIARVNADGTLDTGFDPKTNNVVFSVAVQADGKVLLGGTFTTLSATTRRYLARVNADGTLDTGFDPTANNVVYSVAVQVNGKVLLGGAFTTLQPNNAASATTRVFFARLNNDAALQTLSAPDTSQVLWSRGGTAPEISQVTFEQSADGGGTWTTLGDGTRVGTTSNWQLTGLSLPTAGYLRARGRAASGYGNGGSGLIEQVSPYTATPLSTAPTVTTNAATGITPTEATLNATVTSNGAATDVTFRYSRDSRIRNAVTTTTAQNFSSTASGASVSQAITGLAAHTTYYFQANGTNSAGATSGANLSFTTLDSTPVAAPQNVTIDEATALAINLSATDADGDALTYTIATQPAHGTVTLSGNTATYTPSGNYNGSDPFTFTASDFFGGTSSPATVTVTVTVTKVNPTVTTQASSPTIVGSVIADRATLSQALNATGTITFNAYGPNDTSCGGTPAFSSTVTVSGNGNYDSGNFIPLQPGTYRFVATYSGDGNNNGVATACNDPAESVTVGRANPTISTQASANVAFGGSVTDTATLSGAVAPTGTVTFKLYGPNDTSCGGTAVFTSTKTVSNNGASSDPFTPTTAGTYRWIASYSGDTANAATAGTCGAANESVTVNKAATATAVSSSVNPSDFGQSVTFTATVTSTAGTPTGTVQFKIDGTNTGTAVTLDSSGKATFNSSTLSVGNHTIAGDYSGDTNFNPSTNTVAGGQTVNKAAASTAVSSSVNPSGIGQSVTFTATVTSTGGTPTGTVQFQIDGANAGAPVTLDGSGKATYSTATLSAGNHAITADYSADTNFNASTGTLSGGQTVNKAATATAVSSSVNPSDFGQSVTFTATVTSTAGTPTGTVQFKVDGANAGAAVALDSSGKATFSSSTLSAGNHTIAADYSGDTNFEPSTNTLASGQTVKSPPAVSINDVSVTEGNSGTTPESFTVSLSEASSLTVKADYATADGTATAPSDYQNASGTITFAPGETTKTISVLVNGDTTYESDENFAVNLTNPQNATIAGATGTGTIRNDDAAPTVSISDVAQAEGNSGTTNFTFQVTLSAASGQAATVNYATADGTANAPSDYTAASGTVSFAPGETSKSVTVLVNGDTLNEPDETFTVNLTTPVNATIAKAQGVGTIQNDDPVPTISITDVSQPEGNSGTSTMTFAVTLNAPSAQTVKVDYATANGTATAGSDYTATSGTLTFNSGVTSQMITVSVIGDTTFESDETFTVNLTSPQNATIAGATGTGTIRNDDAAPTVQFSPSDYRVSEGAGTATITVTKTGATGVDATVHYATGDGAAKAGSDTRARAATLSLHQTRQARRSRSRSSMTRCVRTTRTSESP